jgi:hypothetical protein
MKHWIGTTNDGRQWQVSDGPVGDRASSADFDNVLDALAYACKPGNVVVFEPDYVPGEPNKGIEALKALCSTVVQTGGMLHGENIGNEPGENDDAPAGGPDWVDLGEAYLLACEALGFEPLYSDDEVRA